MNAVRQWRADFQPILEIAWVEKHLQKRALTALAAAYKPGISLVDWTSFGIMRERCIEDVLTFDRRFSQQGIKTNLK